MAQEAKVWRVDADRPELLKPSRLDEEKRLEDWLRGDRENSRMAFDPKTG